MKLDIRTITDTAHPQTIVPIYFIHTIAHPFCPLPGCWCKTHQGEIVKLLEQISEGEMTLQEATSLKNGNTL